MKSPRGFAAAILFLFALPLAILCETRNDALTRVAFQGLGQNLEGWLLTGFLLWCMMAVLVDGGGTTRLLGLFAVSLAAAARAFASVLPLMGQSLEAIVEKTMLDIENHEACHRLGIMLPIVEPQWPRSKWSAWRS